MNRPVAAARPDMTALDWLQELGLAVCGCLFSSEHPPVQGVVPQRASNSELRRWFDKGAVVINGERPKALDVVERVDTLVLFPKSDANRRSYRFN